MGDGPDRHAYAAPPGAAPPLDSQRLLITGGPFDHLSYILTFAKAFTSPDGLAPRASYPWQWLFDRTPISYSNIYPNPPPARTRSAR